MKKLRLNVEQLTVDSFSTNGDTGDRGTIAAHEATPGCTIEFSCWNCSLGDTACDLTMHCSNVPVC
ncbi:MAG TPA: hypothetical protein VGC13_14140 [Longimicrobium sp.]|jgi:hypothetical protein|uniref:hypothetical protein n=1 Tax=Longimicrobium sp. TaxID=2029185 RepID=UPI002ED9EB6C